MTKVFYEGAELAPHRSKPWLAFWIKKRHEIDLCPPPAPSGPMDIPADLPAAHTLLVGNSGSGKTRLALHLFREQLKAGCSGVFLDFKPETIQQAIRCAEEAGLTRSQLTVLWPREDHVGIPGWNPFAVPPAAIGPAVGQFTSTLKGCFESWGVRLQDVLTNAATVIAGQQLSCWELVRFLQRDDYRERLLRSARNTPGWAEYPEQHEYFLHEYKAVAKTETVPAVLNKLRLLISNRYLKALLCARTDQLALPTLWQQQRAILIHLDGHTLTPDCARILSGLIAQNLFAAAMRKPGDIPVLLVMDELESQEKFLGDAIQEILAKSRQQGLRLLGACQNIEQMSEDLRRLFMGAALRGFFNLEWDDAKRVAQSLSAGQGRVPTRVRVRPEKEGNVSVSAGIVDGKGNRLQASPKYWELFCTKGQGTLAALKVLGAASDIPAFFVSSPLDRRRIALTEYLDGVPKECCRFHGPSPLSVAVTFPRPNVKVEDAKSAAERATELADRLQNLRNRHAIIKARSRPFAEIEILDVAFEDLPDPRDYLANGQSAEEILETALTRGLRIEGSEEEPQEGPEVSDDGNL